MLALQAFATDIRGFVLNILPGLHFFKGKFVDIEFSGLHGEPSAIFDRPKFTNNLRSSVFWHPID